MLRNPSRWTRNQDGDQGISEQVRTRQVQRFPGCGTNRQFGCLLWRNIFVYKLFSETQNDSAMKKFAMKKSHLIAFATLIVLSGNLHASSGGGVGGRDYTFSNTVDQKYERGKANYFSRGVDGKRRNYCIKKGDELVRLTASSVREFTRASTDTLRSNLYLCDSSVLAKEQLSPNQMSSILYYLNKRYRLSLS